MKPPLENACRLEILSETDHCIVGYCRGCNLFHVNLGAITLKLHALQLHALGGSLIDALDAFKQEILSGGTAEVKESPNPVH